MKDKSTADAINDVLEAKMVFPQVAEVGETFIANGGLSLRDLFAIVTMHAMFGSQVDSLRRRDEQRKQLAHLPDRLGLFDGEWR